MIFNHDQWRQLRFDGIYIEKGGFWYLPPRYFFRFYIVLKFSGAFSFVKYPSKIQWFFALKFAISWKKYWTAFIDWEFFLVQKQCLFLIISCISSYCIAVQSEPIHIKNFCGREIDMVGNDIRFIVYICDLRTKKSKKLENPPNISNLPYKSTSKSMGCDFFTQTITERDWTINFLSLSLSLMLR